MVFAVWNISRQSFTVTTTVSELRLPNASPVVTLTVGLASGAIYSRRLQGFFICLPKPILRAQAGLPRQS
jgi:hypothetical protein